MLTNFPGAEFSSGRIAHKHTHTHTWLIFEFFPIFFFSLDSRFLLYNCQFPIRARVFLLEWFFCFCLSTNCTMFLHIFFSAAHQPSCLWVGVYVCVCVISSFFAFAHFKLISLCSATTGLPLLTTRRAGLVLWLLGGFSYMRGELGRWCFRLGSGGEISIPYGEHTRTHKNAHIYKHTHAMVLFVVFFSSVSKNKETQPSSCISY